MLEFSVKKDSLDRFQAAVLAYDTRVKLYFSKELETKLAKDLNETVKKTIREDWYGRPPSSNYGLSGGRLRGPGEDSVTLISSFKSRIKKTSNSLRVEAYSNRVYAGIHAEGGIIRPSGKYLAIPLARAMAWPSFDIEKARIIQYATSTKGPAVLIRRAKIRPKPIGSPKNYLELSSERMLLIAGPSICLLYTSDAADE